MSIFGRRDSELPAEEAEPPAEGTAESHAGAHYAQEPAAEYQPGEPAPAFWRAQGEMSGRDPADAPPPAYGHVPPAGPAAAAHGEQAYGEDPASAVNEAPAGTDAPVPVLTGVVMDAETLVKEPAEAEQPTVAPEPAATEVQEPAVAVAHEPVMPEAQEPPMTEAQEPPMTEAQEPAMTEAHEPAVTEPGEAQEPPMTEAEQQAGAPAPAVAGAGQPAAAAITPQRWSEILVTFVDDPRASVKMAADTVDEAIDEFVNSVRARQRGLAATWQSAEADTEQLRTALREYRKLGQRVQQLDLGETTGS